MKKEIIEVFLILSVCGIILNGCEQKLHLDLKTQSPVPVVNSILMAGDDSIRVQVTWTKNVYEQADFPVEANASVKLYKNDQRVGECRYLGNGWYVIAHHVEATGVYRIVANIEGRATVWGETKVPAPLLDAVIEYDTLRSMVLNRWRDRVEEKNYYWISYAESAYQEVMDTLHLELRGYLETNSSLPDPFNRSFDFEEEIPAEYNYYLRVEDSGLTGKDIELSYKERKLGYTWERDTGCYKSSHFILSLDENYDRYLKSAIINDEYTGDMDSEPLFYTPLWTYSNIHEGVGLVASYAKFEDVNVQVFKKREHGYFNIVNAGL